MRSCWKCGDDELGPRPIVFCRDNDDDECTACHRECLEKRGENLEDLPARDESGPRPLEGEI